MLKKVGSILFILFVVVLFIGQEKASAASVISVDDYLEKNSALSGTTNTTNWANLIKKVSTDGSRTTIQFTKGSYYFDNTILIPSNVTVTGFSSNRNDTKLIFTSPTRAMTTEAANKENPRYTSDITLQNMSISYAIDSVILKNHEYAFSMIHFAGVYDDDKMSASKSYELLSNITIDNITADGNLQANSVIYLGGINGGKINNSTISNSKLQAGIGLEFCKNMEINDNNIRNTGRSGIVLFRENFRTTIKNNVISNWMQRYGYVHFFAPANLEYTEEERKIMADGGIDSYGAGNDTILIDNNILFTGEGANKYMPSNIEINNKLRQDKDPSTPLIPLNHEIAVDKDGKILKDSLDATLQQNKTGYIGIRLSGAENVSVTNNEISMDSYDNFAFVAMYERDRQQIITTPKNIIVKNNFFKSTGRMRYPVRIINGTVNKSRGISLENNIFDIDGLIDNTYKVIVEVRSPVELLTITDNTASWDKTINGWVTVTNNTSPASSNYVGDLAVWGNSGTKKTDATRTMNPYMPSTLKVNTGETFGAITPCVKRLYTGVATYKISDTYLNGVITNNSSHYKAVDFLIDGVVRETASVNTDGTFLINVKSYNLSTNTNVILRYRVNESAASESEMRVLLTY